MYLVATHPIGTCAWIRFVHRLHLSRSIASCLRASHSVCERYTGSGKCRPKGNIIEGSRGIIATSNGRDARRSRCCPTLLKHNRKFHQKDIPDRKIHRISFKSNEEWLTRERKVQNERARYWDALRLLNKKRHINSQKSERSSCSPEVVPNVVHRLEKSRGCPQKWRCSLFFCCCVITKNAAKIDYVPHRPVVRYMSNTHSNFHVCPPLLVPWRGWCCS